ncbi:alpha-adducin-like [Cyprinus carpio]|uniref:Alpha-adducin-like n=1 Tax=Cyprinus carpio TaxID=7962 RepID=A0A9Q9XKZ8_CYPCA|nr:alpha-adducin-like [Cyprinus carpio]
MNGDSGAGVVTAPPPTNPPHKERYFDRVDESSPEYQRERNMAPDLRQDFNMMEQRKRVSMILQSPAFCDELESLIQDQMKKGKTPTSLLALQQIADFMTTSVPTVYPAAPQGGMAALNMSLGMVTPVNDLRGSDSIAYEKGEKLLRCKLAAFYRLADLFGWSQLIYNHLTVRLNSEQERFLIVPFGLLYSEVTASSLVKINLQGEIVDRGSTNLGVNQAGFTLPPPNHTSRPYFKSKTHIHTPAGAAWTKEDSLRQAAVANQFVPLNTNPKEVQEMRNKIREQNLQDKKTAGPQSQVLTGAVVDRSYVQRVTIWHDAPLSDCTDSIDGIDPSESFSPSRSIRKGELVTASKAIIEKEYQPRVIVSKTGPNPFNKLTDQDLDEYRREVELKQKGPEAQVEESPSAPEEAQTPDVTSTQEHEDPQATTAPPPSIIESGRASGHDSPVDATGSPHKEFHSAVLKALGCDAESEREPSAGQTLEVEEGKVPSTTCTPPSSPVRVEEEEQQEQTSKDESDAATLRQTLPDLTPDEPSEVSALPAEDPAPGQTDSAPQPEGEEPVAGDDAAGDHGSDESPNKSPSKKKKKFRTPSFLKKNKKKSETQ